MTTLLLRTGDKVRWTMGRIESKGVVHSDNGEDVDVLTHYIGGIRDHRNIKVDKKLLELDY